MGLKAYKRPIDTTAMPMALSNRFKLLSSANLSSALMPISKIPTGKAEARHALEISNEGEVTMASSIANSKAG